MAAILALALVATVFFFVRALREQSTQFAQERAELLNRIQRPEHIPVPASGEWSMPEREPDEWNMVGQIKYDDKYGLED